MITCPTCANRMVTYPNDWRVCLACAVFDHSTPDHLESWQPDSREHRDTGRDTHVARLEPIGAWQS